MLIRPAALLLLVPFLAACGSFGPKTVAHDRPGSARVTADSAKQQTLLNVVRLRYGDHVSFFRVG
jgi:predicted small lipoprotein YifL